MTHRAAHGEVNIRRNKRGHAPKDAAGRAGHPSASVYGNSSTGLDGGEHGAWSHELGEEVNVQWGECVNPLPWAGLHHADPQSDGFFDCSQLTSPQHGLSTAEPASVVLVLTLSEGSRWCYLDVARWSGEMSFEFPQHHNPWGLLPSPHTRPRIALGSLGLPQCLAGHGAVLPAWANPDIQ